LAAALLLAGCGQAAPGPNRSGPEGGAPVADSAPCPHGPGTPIRGLAAVDLPCLTGPGSVRVSAVHSQVEVVNVWASWCGPCRRESARLAAAQRTAPRGVLFLGVDVKDSPAGARGFLAGRRVGYPQVSDPTGRFARALHLFGVPSTVVVDRSGRIRWRHDGQLGAADVQRLMAQVRSAVRARTAPR